MLFLCLVFEWIWAPISHHLTWNEALKTWKKIASLYFFCLINLIWIQSPTYLFSLWVWFVSQYEQEKTCTDVIGISNLHRSKCYLIDSSMSYAYCMRSWSYPRTDELEDNSNINVSYHMNNLIWQHGRLIRNKTFYVPELQRMPISLILIVVKYFGRSCSSHNNKKKSDPFSFHWSIAKATRSRGVHPWGFRRWTRRTFIFISCCSKPCQMTCYYPQSGYNNAAEVRWPRLHRGEIRRVSAFRKACWDEV